jgi:hypothetical protein
LFEASIDCMVMQMATAFSTMLVSPSLPSGQTANQGTIHCLFCQHPEDIGLDGQGRTKDGRANMPV